MQSYDHRRIEKKWQRIWKQTGLYHTREELRIKDSKCYALDMFPYPSGDGLHVGHPKGYIATDVYSRMKLMQGRTILHPMGWDAFGLPAENYAIQNKIHPETAVKKNIKRFKKQLENLGFNYDWTREINTTDPNYYRWTQWIFLQMFHRGLAYRSQEPINWCLSCQTGLANEDLEDGRCERCGSVVEKRAIPQWVLKITEYADRLLEGLPSLNWPEHIKEQQRNWIGRSSGAEIIFKLRYSSQTDAEIKIFTTRPDTLFGATYLVLAPEHAFVQEQIRNPKSEIRNKSEVQNYLNEAKTKSEIERTAEGREKTGVEVQGITAVNPANGEEIPVWIADYVLAEYGTGAIMAVPAHDERDWKFAGKFKLPIRMVVCPHYPAPTCPVLDKAFLGAGHLVDSGKFTGLPSEEAKKAITEFVAGKFATKYKLRDWVFSRQRYWGEPIPLVFCGACKRQAENSKSQVPHSKQNPKKSIYQFSKGELMNPGWIGVPEDKLPVKLPKVKFYAPTGTGESPLANIPKFTETTCPQCGGPARRETNTMPQWAGSCWYYIAYCIGEKHKSQKPNSPPANRRTGKRFSNLKSQRTKRILTNWLPVDTYVGGAEHATRHLIYARFWHKFLHDIGIVHVSEPFERLQNVGLILASDGRKMSKRFGNVINPDDIVEKVGADSLRIYEMFMGPFNQAIAWSADSLVGARRFLERVWRLSLKVNGQRSTVSDSTESLLHQTIKKVTEDIDGFRFNTAISACMIFANALEKEMEVPRNSFESLLKLLAPFAPYMSEELWSRLGYTRSIHESDWPVYDAALARASHVTIVVQVNGKTRGSFEADFGAAGEELIRLGSALPAIQKWLGGQKPKKTIAVPNRLVNFVM